MKQFILFLIASIVMAIVGSVYFVLAMSIIYSHTAIAMFLIFMMFVAMFGIRIMFNNMLADLA